MQAAHLVSTALSVNSSPQCLWAWPATPDMAAAIEPMVTEVDIQCRKVLSFWFRSILIEEGSMEGAQEIVEDSCDAIAQRLHPRDLPQRRPWRRCV